MKYKFLTNLSSFSDILKIHVPELHKHRYHTHYVFIHHQEPKKAPKKKEVKHVHHKHTHLPGHINHHWHTPHAHKHSSKHGHSAGKPSVVIHTVKHPLPVHKTHGHKVAPKHKTHMPKTKTHDQPSYPFTHDDVRFSSGLANQGYQVTENFDPEFESHQDFSSDDYASSGNEHGLQNDMEYYSQGGQQSSQAGGYPSVGQQYSEGGSPQSYNAQFFMNPITHQGGQYGQYGHYVSPGISSYDISPYHTVSNHQQTSVQADGNNNYINSDDGGSSYDEAISQQGQGEGEGFRGEYDFDYEPSHYDGHFGGYGGATQVDEDFEENIPGFSNQHKTIVKNINHAMITKAYDDRMHKFTNNNGDKKTKTIRHTFTQGGHYKLPF